MVGISALPVMTCTASRMAGPDPGMTHGSPARLAPKSRRFPCRIGRGLPGRLSAPDPCMLLLGMCLGHNE